MSELDAQRSSYFDPSRRREHSSESYGDVSPLSTSVKTLPFRQARTVRPSLRESHRSYSDSAFQRKDHRLVQTIEEDFPSHHSTPPRTPLSPDLPSSPEREVRISTPYHSSSRSSDQLARRKRQEQASQSTKSSQENTLQHRRQFQRVSQTWSKLLAGRLGSEISTSDRASSSSYDVRIAPDEIKIPRTSIQPLRPPSTTTKRSEPSSEHRIRIEKSFTDLRVTEPKAATPPPTTRRNSSINPLQLFSASVSRFRRVKKSPSDHSSRSIEPRHKQSQQSVPNARDHKSNLRKQETAAGLARVTSILQEVKRLDNKAHNASTRSPSSGSLNNGNRNNCHDPAKSPVILARVKSMEMNLDETDSHNSSFTKLKQGHTPLNTPEEQATYKVINQNGEVEEFLKVDISIRGQTNYLPSEARRIHTPPLPSEDRDRKPRGFFFDYNLPSGNKERGSNATDNGAQPRLARDNAGEQLSAYGRASRSPTLSKRTAPETSKNRTKLKPGDWYATQLADLDSSSEDESFSHDSSRPYLSEKRGMTTFETEQQRIRDEAQLDHNIPEHLPTSPLCPRHPRYWRIMKNRGSQFRGCWMHGYGEFTEADRLKYGIR